MTSTIRAGEFFSIFDDAGNVLNNEGGDTLLVAAYSLDLQELVREYGTWLARSSAASNVIRGFPLWLDAMGYAKLKSRIKVKVEDIGLVDTQDDRASEQAKPVEITWHTLSDASDLQFHNIDLVRAWQRVSDADTGADIGCGVAAELVKAMLPSKPDWLWGSDPVIQIMHPKDYAGFYRVATSVIPGERDSEIAVRYGAMAYRVEPSLPEQEVDAHLAAARLLTEDMVGDAYIRHEEGQVLKDPSGHPIDENVVFGLGLASGGEEWCEVVVSKISGEPGLLVEIGSDADFDNETIHGLQSKHKLAVHRVKDWPGREGSSFVAVFVPTLRLAEFDVVLVDAKVQIKRPLAA